MGFTLADQLAIMAEMRDNPRAVAAELAELRAMRERATLMHERVAGRSAFGLGVRAAARAILGHVPSPEGWIAPLIPGRVQEEPPRSGPRHGR